MGPLQLPPGSLIDISAQGDISVDGEPAGSLRIVTFPPDTPLERLNGASFTTNAAPEDLVEPDVRQGFVEKSNVNTLSEMSDMIVQFRLFESQQKMLQTADQTLGTVVRDLGKF